MNWYVIPWKKYVTFEGRARRKEFWIFTLINMIIASIITAIFPTNTETMTPSVVSSIWSLVILLPSLAVAVRRLHDTSRSGWNLLWALLPIIGWIILLVYYCQDSHDENEYGPNPKTEEPEA